MELEFVKSFASKAHSGQLRKYTEEPYVNHPIRVSEVLLDLYPQATEAMVKAAILHDVVEDTEISLQEIENIFGNDIANLVSWVTDISKPEDGNRKQRKHLDMLHLQDAPHKAQIVKLADIIDNTRDILTFDKKFGRVYIQEKENQIHCMRDSVKDTYIWKVTERILIDLTNELN